MVQWKRKKDQNSRVRYLQNWRSARSMWKFVFPDGDLTGMGSLNYTLFPLLQDKFIKRSLLTAEIELINTQGSVAEA